ncbi:MAG: metal-dependent hydrolase [Nanoarchaeota archaeon]|nr:metal-dependent hydrolase [Nanoarchaeota archaeon]
MPLATTHILVAIILIELFRNFFVKDNKKFPRYYILIAALGGIIPDLDIAGYYVLSLFGFTFEQIHRTFFHTIFIPLILFLIGIFIYQTKMKSKEFGKRHINLHTTFFILAAGSLLHLILDATLSGYIIPFYPFSSFSVGLNIIKLFPTAWQSLILPTLDGILLIFWIFWMEFKLKISDYF